MKVFFLLSRIPYPLIKGDKLRAYHQLKELSVHHEIYLCALNDRRLDPEALEQLKPYCKEIHIIRLPRLRIWWNVLVTFMFGKKPLQVGYFYNRNAAKKVDKLIRNIAPDHIYCQLIRTSEYIRKLKNIPRTLDYMDALSAGMERRSKNARGWMRPVFEMETRRLKHYEHQVWEDFDHSTIISTSDRDKIVQYNNEDIIVVPNGVDLKYFHPQDAEKIFDLVFTGNMAYPPNVISVEYLINEIMPLIWARRPETNLLISGANPLKKLLALGSDRIKFSGWVADIRSAYAEGRIFVAPMQIGSGLQNKLLEAMAMNLPCVSSELANRSLGAREGEEIVIGKDEEDYAQKILELLDDPDRAKELADNGHAFVKRAYNWTRSNQLLEELMKQ